MTCPDSETCRREGVPAKPELLRGCLPNVRSVTGWAGSSVHSSATSGSRRRPVTGSWRPECSARNGAKPSVSHDTLAQGPKDQGSRGQARRAWARRRRGPPATCVVRRVSNREIERRTPASVSNPVRPGFTLAYGITGPEGETCGELELARNRGSRTRVPAERRAD